MVEIRKLGAVLGAEVRGFDPRSPMSDEEFRTVEQAFLDHLVLRFRDAPMSAHELRAFGNRFGPLREHIAKDYRHPEVPEVVMRTLLAPLIPQQEVGRRP